MNLQIQNKEVLKMNKLKTILQITWIAVGLAFISLIIFCGIQFNFVIKDVRNVTSQANINDVRHFLDIIETQQKIRLEQVEK